MDHLYKRRLILQIIVIGLLSCIFISLPAWFTTQRVIPSIPVISILSTLPTLVNNTITFVLISSLIGTLFSSKYERVTLTTSLLALTTSCLFDQIRLQPWIFSYGFMLLALVLYSHKRKLNLSFMEVTFPWMIEPLINLSPSLFGESTHWMAITAASVEAVFGLGLLIPKLRKTSVVILSFMHLFILLMLGPFGLNYNEVIWPWNISYVLLLYILFWNDKASSYKYSIAKFDKALLVAIVILFGLMPVFSFTGHWPKYFSSALYSGNKIKSSLYISDELKNEWIESVDMVITPFENKINLDSWALKELRLPPYPSVNYTTKLFYSLCKHSDNEADIILVIDHEPSITSNERLTESFFCSD